ncbi:MULTISPECIES: colicin immunity domain-containing protein [unclassified Nocardia]|uniref:colicin immunity domain-containing protein n=1 Tax=unclassified Nocardia TaxID=2637762 RepID=UPI0024A7B00D|nr:MULTISPECIES: colicin immunity domain-containing protein [unclassified Nocardia]
MFGRNSVDRALANYERLIGEFVSGVIDAPTFESRYLMLFKNEAAKIPLKEFDILDGLFADVDEYVSDPGLRAEAGGLDDEQLRSRAAAAYKILFLANKE